MLAEQAAHACTVPGRALLARADAGRVAIAEGADPVLMLALVVWPSENVTAALERA